MPLARRAPVTAVLAALAPDRLGVSDRTTLRWTGEWARGHRVPAVAVRTDLAALLATADVTPAPGPVETFGLAALEALACGTPVVAAASSALPALIGPAGAAAGTPAEYAGAVRRILAVPEPVRRARATTRAERYTWPAAVSAFLAAHGAALPAGLGAERLPW